MAIDNKNIEDMFEDDLGGQVPIWHPGRVKKNRFVSKEISDPQKSREDELVAVISDYFRNNVVSGSKQDNVGSLMFAYDSKSNSVDLCVVFDDNMDKYHTLNFRQTELKTEIDNFKKIKDKTVYQLNAAKFSKQKSSLNRKINGLEKELNKRSAELSTVSDEMGTYISKVAMLNYGRKEFLQKLDSNVLQEQLSSIGGNINLHVYGNENINFSSGSSKLFQVLSLGGLSTWAVNPFNKVGNVTLNEFIDTLCGMSTLYEFESGWASKNIYTKLKEANKPKEQLFGTPKKYCGIDIKPLKESKRGADDVYMLFHKEMSLGSTFPKDFESNPHYEKAKEHFETAKAKYMDKLGSKHDADGAYRMFVMTYTLWNNGMFDKVKAEQWIDIAKASYERERPKHKNNVATLEFVDGRLNQLKECMYEINPRRATLMYESRK